MTEFTPTTSRKKIIFTVASVAIIGASFLCFHIAHRTVGETAGKGEVAGEATSVGNVAQAKTARSEIRLLFVGDMMFDRYIRQTIGKRGDDFIFRNVDTMLGGNDLVIGNLEGPITDNASVSVDSKMGERNNYIFTFDPEVASILKKHGIGLVDIGNNHIDNFGDAGISSTKRYLSESGIGYFGDPQDTNSNAKTIEVKGNKIAFVAYDQFVSDGENRTIEDLKSAKDSGADLTVVFTHWGTEFVPDPDDKIRNLAHEFVDNGADLIIGSHPHVIQSKEEYKGKTIYYSLGNFIFDQYFRPETQEGLAVQADISPDGKIFLHESKVRMKTGGQTVLE